MRIKYQNSDSVELQLSKQEARDLRDALDEAPETQITTAFYDLLVSACELLPEA